MLNTSVSLLSPAQTNDYRQAWQALGDVGYAKRVDTLLDLARYMADQIEKRAADGFVLTVQPACSNVCFFHIPEFLRSDPIAVEMLKTGNPDILKTDAAAGFVEKCKKVPPQVKMKMMEEGTNTIPPAFRQREGPDGGCHWPSR